MKISEIIVESSEGSLIDDAADAIPDLMVFPELENTDPYRQYRFGLTLATALAVEKGEVDYEKESVFGEKLAIVAGSPEEAKTIELAKKLYGTGGESKHVSTIGSEETDDVNKVSPVANLGPVKRKSE